MSLPDQSTVLSSWKDIARFMGKGVRTVQRWERELGLPVRRPNGASQKSAVVLHRSELELWLETRFSPRAGRKSLLPTEASSLAARAALRESLGKARELRTANALLARQVTQSLHRLSQQCEALSKLSNQVPVRPSQLKADSLVAGAELVV